MTDPTSNAPGIDATQGDASLDNVVVILSRTTEPMNIGAACRAMKTMGLKHLRLIDPLNPKGRSAKALAHGAEDILENAEVVDTLQEAIHDCLVVIGTTARQHLVVRSLSAVVGMSDDGELHLPAADEDDAVHVGQADQRALVSRIEPCFVESKEDLGYHLWISFVSRGVRPASSLS